MKDEIMISVIVPVYNVEAYLQRCLNSLVQQTYSRLEIIVIDDGSTDSSGFICDQYQKTDNRFKVIHQNNTGLSGARNAGLKEAKGKYIAFVDSDDWLELNAFELLLRIAESNDTDIVCYDYYISFANKDNYQSKRFGEVEILDSKHAVEQLVAGKIMNYTWSKLYKRVLFENIVFPEKRTYEDIGTTYKLFLKANKICLLYQPLYHYLQREDSITHLSKSSFEQYLKDAETVFLFKSNMINDISNIYPELYPILVGAAEKWAFKLYNCTLMINDKKLTRKQKLETKIFLKKHFSILVTLNSTSISHKLRLIILRFMPYIYDKMLFPYLYRKRGNLS